MATAWDDATRDQGNPMILMLEWKTGFDAPAEGEREESGGGLARFGAGDLASQPSRRNSARYAPASTRAWIRWRDEGRWHISPADLVNLSLGGALIRLAEPPPSAQATWISPGTPDPDRSVECRVLEVTPGPDGEFHARMEFQNPCSPEFFLAVGHRTWRD